MSWQAFEAIRDLSESRGATRTVGFVLASYANAEGGSVFPSLNTIRRGTGARPKRNSNGKLELAGGVGKKAIVDARRWFVDNGEAIVTATRASHTHTPVPVLDFSPLLAKGSPAELSAPQGFAENPPKGSPAELLRVSSANPMGSVSEPEPEVSSSVKSSDKSSVDPSPFSTNNNDQGLQLLGELLAQRPSKAGALLASTERSIESLRDELGVDVDAEIDARAGFLLAVAA